MAETLRPSWTAEPLGDILNGTRKPTIPKFMRRSDGIHLLYPGKVHSFHGESESAKSLIAQAESLRTINAGGTVLYLDFESDAVSVVGRFLSMGVDPRTLLKKLRYVRPEVDPDTVGEAEKEAFSRHLSRPYDLIVIDGVTAAFDVYGLNSMDNGDTMKWGRKLPLKLASETGAAVLLIDHVTKSSDGRGRFAIGAQMKMSFLTGAAFTVKMSHPLGVGVIGKVDIRIGKDREGLVRSHSTDFRSSDQTAAIAVAVFDSTEPGRLHYRLECPSGGSEIVNPSDDMPKTMRSVLDALTGANGWLGLKAICQSPVDKGGKPLAPSTTTRHLVKLVDSGHVTEAKAHTPENRTKASRYRITEAGRALTA
ncbi:AAA family ATPase [Arthrobacter sp. PAMC25284]|uniref:AAA family ATPase n=1 Tax=Arthrobacter sp. PAMC25284 TaxID=2861279 RepID=UPI001C62AB0B|nr:AAA family ATPase [Arthrobacter sp. PAMC25284]QYF88548.1 AAA family ATPase [Arthrobacter sp. PAMC25284]